MLKWQFYPDRKWSATCKRCLLPTRVRVFREYHPSYLIHWLVKVSMCATGFLGYKPSFSPNRKWCATFRRPLPPSSVILENFWCHFRILRRILIKIRCEDADFLKNRLILNHLPLGRQRWRHLRCSWHFRCQKKYKKRHTDNIFSLCNISFSQLRQYML